MSVLVVESWRFCAASYAMVNQHHCLELLKRPGITLYHTDRPLPDANWRSSKGLFAPEQEEAIRGIPSPGPGVKADALLRLVFPFDFSPSDVAKRFIMGTAEYGSIPLNFVAGNRLITEAMKGTGFRILTPSNWSRDGFLRMGVKRAEVEVVPHGVDVGTFRAPAEEERERARAGLGWSDRFVLFHNSSLGWNKGVDSMLATVAALAGEFPRLLLVLKGLDSLYNSRQSLADMLEKMDPGARALVEPRVRYIGGELGASEMAGLYQAADAYFCPYIAEGFNLPALEAVACGLPLLCTAGGPTDDFARPEFAIRIASRPVPYPQVRGTLLQPAFAGCVGAVRRALTDARWVAGARVAGAQFVREGWTWRHAVDRLVGAMGL